MRFMAMAIASCASRLIEPNDMAAVAKRLTISSADSTSSSGMARAGSALKSSKLRKVVQRRSWLLIRFANWRYSLASFWRVACCT